MLDDSSAYIFLFILIFLRLVGLHSTQTEKNRHTRLSILNPKTFRLALLFSSYPIAYLHACLWPLK